MTEAKDVAGIAQRLNENEIRVLMLLSETPEEWVQATALHTNHVVLEPLRRLGLMETDPNEKRVWVSITKLGQAVALELTKKEGK